MLTVAMPARNHRQLTARALTSLFHSCRSCQNAVRFLLLDDASDPSEELSQLFSLFAQQVEAPLRAVRFPTRQHYTGVFNYALSQADGGDLFFLSNDMVLTPSFLHTVLAVSALNPEYGVIRGTSPFVTGHPEYRIEPPAPLGDQSQIFAFSAYQAERWGLEHRQDRLLSGDAVLVKAQCRAQIGLFDPHYWGYFSDLDYGLRVQRGGMKLICALGAWLEHTGAGHLKAGVGRQHADLAAAFGQREAEVQADYRHFRSKWDPTLPEVYRPGSLDLEALVAQGPLRDDHGEYRPPADRQLLIDRDF